jgi:hypothetical protein
MTNSSPPDPQNPIPERRTRPAAGVTFDEMIAIIVAFSAIGAILFWSLGGRRNRIASNLGIDNDNLSIFGDSDTVGIGSNLFGSIDRDGEIELEELEEELPNQTPIAILPQRELEQPAYRLDSDLRFTPYGGVATLPGLRTNPDNRSVIVVPDEIEVETEPEAAIPDEIEVETEPEAVVPETEAEPKTAVPETEAESKTAVPEEPDETTMPVDVTPDYWAYPFVKQIREQSLVPEIARNQNFEPDTLITRATMATFISQAFDMRPLTENIKSFKDVPNRNEIAEDIDKAVRLGFMQGYSQEEFRPLENIPRYQVLVALATGLGLKPSGDVEQTLQQFDDSDGVPSWARQQVAAAIENGLLVNRPDFASNALMPQTPATRAEVAAMIHQALVQSDTLKPLESEYIVRP